MVHHESILGSPPGCNTLLAVNHISDQRIKPNTLRLSIGPEHIDDIITYLEKGFAAVK